MNKVSPLYEACGLLDYEMSCTDKYHTQKETLQSSVSSAL